MVTLLRMLLSFNEVEENSGISRRKLIMCTTIMVMVVITEGFLIDLSH
jgi:hypothetical protein